MFCFVVAVDGLSGASGAIEGATVCVESSL
jgi:hypothetical protein